MLDKWKMEEYNQTHQKQKPMRKKSRFWEKSQRAAGGGIAVWISILNGLSRAAWNDVSIERVGVAGNRTRYQSGAYDSTWGKWTLVNLSGTAIIRFYYRLRQFAWDGFFIGGKSKFKLAIVTFIDVQRSAPLLLRKLWKKKKETKLWKREY